MTFAQGHALLIGVNQYQHAPRLNAPITATDVLTLATTLCDPYVCGYPASQVTVLTDVAATHTGITTALTDLAQRTTTDDTVLLCYSGHGHYDTQGTYCLMSHETQLHATTIVPGTALSQHDLLALVRAIPARRVLLVFNACHAGSLSPTLTTDEPFTGMTVPNDTSTALLTTGEGRIIITACRANQYAFIGSGPQTIFMQAFIAGLQGTGHSSPPQSVTVFDLYTSLYNAVDAAVQQLPTWLHQRYGARQEPELTILKGVGPFVVALPHGTHPATHAAMTTDLPRAAAVREVDRVTSQQHWDQRSGIFLDGQASLNGQAIGHNYGSITIGSTSPQPVPTLSQILVQLDHAKTQAAQHRNTPLVNDLSIILNNLQTAQTTPSHGGSTNQATSLRAARNLLAEVAYTHPHLTHILRLLDQLLPL